MSFSSTDAVASSGHHRPSIIPLTLGFLKAMGSAGMRGVVDEAVLEVREAGDYKACANKCSPSSMWQSYACAVITADVAPARVYTVPVPYLTSLPEYRNVTGSYNIKIKILMVFEYLKYKVLHRFQHACALNSVFCPLSLLSKHQLQPQPEEPWGKTERMTCIIH